MKIRELAAKHGINDLGCGDNSCWFGSPGGMGTNGGCFCWPRGVSARNVSQDDLDDMRRLVRTLVTLLQKVAEDA